MEIQTTITTEQVIKGTLGKPRFGMHTNIDQQYWGVVTFPVSGGSELQVEIKPEEWNEFWSNFSSGKYLIERLKTEYDLSTLVIPNDIEEWFVNMV